MPEIIEAILAIVVVLVLSQAFWSINPITSILLLIFGGLLIYKGTS